jgi:hypothetical protein
MSDLSLLLHKVEAWFAGIVGPSGSPAVSQAATSLSKAASDVEAAIPVIATAAANAALALIPGGLGSALDPVADQLIDEVCAKLMAKKSQIVTLPSPTPALAAALAPGAVG